jgi:hypothetical protein
VTDKKEPKAGKKKDRKSPPATSPAPDPDPTTAQAAEGSKANGGKGRRLSSSVS